MQESMVKVVLGLVGVVCLAVGAMLLIAPGWIMTISVAETINMGWLRVFGAGLLGLQGFGLLTAAFRRRDTNPLVSVAALTSTIQAGALWYSVFTKEFSATTSWPLILGTIGLTGAAVLLWFAWMSRSRSLKGLAPKAKRSGKAESTEEPAVSGQTAIPEMGDEESLVEPALPSDEELEELAGPSPRDQE